MNQYFVVRAIKEASDQLVGAPVSAIEKFKVKNVAAVVSQLRKRGHNIVTNIRTVKGKKQTFYAMPFGTRDQEAKLSARSRAKIEKQLQSNLA
jgi:predicted  nucleic acid-binding Zn ribbon protein